MKLNFVSGLVQTGSLRFVKALGGIEDYTMCESYGNESSSHTLLHTPLSRGMDFVKFSPHRLVVIRPTFPFSIKDIILYGICWLFLHASHFINIIVEKGSAIKQTVIKSA